MIIAVNLGGCIIPVGIVLHLLLQQLVAPTFDLLLALPVTSAACYVFSRPVPGVGIAMPVLLAPLVAALIALATGSRRTRHHLPLPAGYSVS